MLAIDWARIVPASVVPVVGLSACGLLSLAFYNRMVAVVARLRSFQRERLSHIESLNRLGCNPDASRSSCLHHQRLIQMLEGQTREVLSRAKLLRRTLQFLLFTIAILALCSLSMGVSVVWPPAVFAAAPLFFLGMGLLVSGISFAIIEIGRALRPVELESSFVEKMAQELKDLHLFTDQRGNT
jgi:hypothetical protein